MVGGMLVNRLKDNLVSTFWQLAPHSASAHELDKLVHSVAPSTIVSDGFKGGSDLTLNLSNPIFTSCHNQLDTIASALVEASQSWQVPLASYTVSGKSILFNVNREVAIPSILSGQLEGDHLPTALTHYQHSSVTIVNTAKDGLRQLTSLRFQYIEETLVSLLKTVGAETTTKTIRDGDQSDGDPLRRSFKLGEGSSLQINIHPFKSRTPFDLEESQFTIEYGSKLMFFLRLFTRLLGQSESRSRIIILIHINDWKVGEKAITAWSILTANSVDPLEWVTFIPIADINSDLSLDEIRDYWRSIIVKQSETPYTVDQVECLIETCLRYTITSISPKAFHNLDLSKYKEALFIQYNYARLAGIRRKFHQITTPLPLVNVDLRLLRNNHEWKLIYHFIAKVPDLLTEVLQSNPIAIHKIPNFVKTFVNYISIYYNYTRVITEINDRSLPLANARIVMIDRTRSMLHQLVNLIQINPVQFM